MENPIKNIQNIQTNKIIDDMEKKLKKDDEDFSLTYIKNIIGDNVTDNTLKLNFTKFIANYTFNFDKLVQNFVIFFEKIQENNITKDDINTGSNLIYKVIKLFFFSVFEKNENIKDYFVQKDYDDYNKILIKLIELLKEIQTVSSFINRKNFFNIQEQIKDTGKEIMENFMLYFVQNRYYILIFINSEIVFYLETINEPSELKKKIDEIVNKDPLLSKSKFTLIYDNFMMDYATYLICKYNTLNGNVIELEKELNELKYKILDIFYDDKNPVIDNNSFKDRFYSIFSTFKENINSDYNIIIKNETIKTIISKWERKDIEKFKKKILKIMIDNNGLYCKGNFNEKLDFIEGEFKTENTNNYNKIYQLLYDNNLSTIILNLKNQSLSNNNMSNELKMIYEKFNEDFLVYLFMNNIYIDNVRDDDFKNYILEKKSYSYCYYYTIFNLNIMFATYKKDIIDKQKEFNIICIRLMNENVETINDFVKLEEKISNLEYIKDNFPFQMTKITDVFNKSLHLIKFNNDTNKYRVDPNLGIYEYYLFKDDIKNILKQKHQNFSFEEDENLDKKKVDIEISDNLISLLNKKLSENNNRQQNQQRKSKKKQIPQIISQIIIQQNKNQPIKSKKQQIPQIINSKKQKNMIYLSCASSTTSSP